MTIKLGGSEVVGQVSAVRREAEVGWDDVARVAGAANGKGGGTEMGTVFEGCGVETWDVAIGSSSKVSLAWVGPPCLVSGRMLLRYW